jgi:hypothetical protein
MKLKQLHGHQLLSVMARESFARMSFNDLANARFALQRCLPNHLVAREGDRLVVTTKDKAFRVAEFKAVENSGGGIFF